MRWGHSIPWTPVMGKNPLTLPGALQSHTRGQEGVASLALTQPQSSHSWYLLTPRVPGGLARTCASQEKQAVPGALGVLASLLFFSRRHPALWGLRLEATCHRCSAGTTAESPACPSSTSAGTTGTQAEKKAFIFKVTTVTEATSSPGSPPPCWPSVDRGSVF